jgi:hypothetical protein
MTSSRQANRDIVKLEHMFKEELAVLNAWLDKLIDEEYLIEQFDVPRSDMVGLLSTLDAIRKHQEKQA